MPAFCFFHYEYTLACDKPIWFLLLWHSALPLFSFSVLLGLFLKSRKYIIAFQQRESFHNVKHSTKQQHIGV